MADGWNGWCDRGMTYIVNEEAQVASNACGIFCNQTGAKWGSRPATFSIPAETVKEMANTALEKNYSGVLINGQKYQYLRSLKMDGFPVAIYKNQHDGISCGVTSKCVIIGMYGKGTQPNWNTEAVFQVMKNLQDAGF